jgi:hypothetical protein
MAKNKEKPVKFTEIEGGKVDFSEYMAENFYPDTPDAAVRLQARLNELSSWGFDYMGVVSGKVNSILLFKFRKVT